GCEQHGDEDAVLDDREDRLIGGVRRFELARFPVNQRGHSRAATIDPAPMAAAWGAETRAVRGPREEPTGAYAVVREDRRRPRTKHGEVDWRPIIRVRCF